MRSNLCTAQLALSTAVRNSHRNRVRKSSCWKLQQNTVQYYNSLWESSFTSFLKPLLSCCCCWVLLYGHRNRWFIRDGSPGRPPGLSHSSWTLKWAQLLRSWAPVAGLCDAYNDSESNPHLWSVQLRFALIAPSWLILLSITSIKTVDQIAGKNANNYKEAMNMIKLKRHALSSQTSLSARSINSSASKNEIECVLSVQHTHQFVLIITRKQWIWLNWKRHTSSIQTSLQSVKHPELICSNPGLKEIKKLVRILTYQPLCPCV